MMFEVTIEETISDTFKIVAESIKEAEKIAKKLYNKGEIVLEPGYIICKKMQVSDIKKDKIMEWREF